MIKGNLITLVLAKETDTRKIYEWLTHSDLTSSFLGPPDFPDNPMPEWEQFKLEYNAAFFNDPNPDNGGSYIIHHEDEEIGYIYYNEINRNTNTVELDIWLSNSSNAQKGYGTDALLTLCFYLEKHLNIERFFLAPSARNKRAIRAFEKAGFTLTANYPENFRPDYIDAVVMEKLVKR